MGQHRIPSNILQKIEQTDLISYGLIPEFVGRFPVICTLQVGGLSSLLLAAVNDSSQSIAGASGAVPVGASASLNWHCVCCIDPIEML